MNIINNIMVNEIDFFGLSLLKTRVLHLLDIKKIVFQKKNIILLLRCNHNAKLTKDIRIQVIFRNQRRSGMTWTGIQT